MLRELRRAGPHQRPVSLTFPDESGRTEQQARPGGLDRQEAKPSVGMAASSPHRADVLGHRVRADPCAEGAVVPDAVLESRVAFQATCAVAPETPIPEPTRGTRPDRDSSP